MEPILEQILKSPLLNEYSKIIRQKVETEEQKRIRFYNQITEQEKAEFIEGEIICHSPVKIEHNIAGKLLLILLQTYVSIKKLGFVGYEKILVKLTRNDYEPDLCFFGNEKTKKFTKNQMFFPAPDFVVEILSESTEKRDRGIKFVDYALHGVKEYWIIDPETKLVEQYILHEQKFEFFQKHSSHSIQSFEIEGFSIPINAIFDEHENTKTLLKIMNNQ
jgi:Uma2 family endonuclease